MKKSAHSVSLINPFLMVYEDADKFYFAGISPVIDQFGICEENVCHQAERG
jgi:hypothetical protein